MKTLWQCCTALALTTIVAGKAHGLGRAQGSPQTAVVQTKVPTVVDHPLAQARTLLQKANLQLGRVDTATSPVTPGTVIRQSVPANTLVPVGSVIDVVIAGSAPNTDDVGASQQEVRVPDLVGQSLDQARKLLNGRNLRVGQVTTGTGSAAPGTVIAQSVPAETVVDSGRKIDLVLMPGLTTVPNLVGESQVSAAILLAIAKLKDGSIGEITDDQRAGKVIRQDPSAGDQVSVGTPVNIWIGIHTPVTVPDLSGSSVPDATAALQAVGLKLGKVDHKHTGGGTGLVISQNPHAKSVVALGTKVKVTISDPRLVKVPPVVGRPLADAVALLEKSRLTAAPPESIPSDSSVGTVITQNPGAGSSVAEGTPVALQVAAPRQINVPNLVGGTATDAARALQAAGLVLGPADTTQHKGGHGLVIKQQPAAETPVLRGTAVSIEISIPIPPVVVPNVISRTAAEATKALQAAGLSAGPIDRVEREGGEDTVFAQQPSAGSSVPRGARVRLQVATRVVLVTVPDVVGQSSSGAKGALEAAGLGVGRVGSTESDSTPDAVLAQDPKAGTKVVRGTAVALELAIARRPRVPNVVGVRAAAAESLLQGARLRVERIDSSVGLGSGGLVLRQTPVAGTLISGDMLVSVWVGVSRLWLVVAIAATLSGAGLTPSTIRKLRDFRWRRRLHYEPRFDRGRQTMPDSDEPLASHDVSLLARSGKQVIEAIGSEEDQT